MIMLDSEHDWRAGSHQHNWLEADLSAVNRSVTPWIVFTRFGRLLSTSVTFSPQNTVLKKFWETFSKCQTEKKQ